MYNPSEYDYDPYSGFDQDEYLYGRYGKYGGKKDNDKKEKKNHSNGKNDRCLQIVQSTYAKKKELKIQNSLKKSDEEAKVIFSEKALTKIQTLVMLCDLEVGWHGTGKKLEKGKYLIEDIHLYPQKTTGTTIQCDDEQYGQWLTNWIIKDPETVDKLCFHGHSHVNMATFSSSTDRDLQDDTIEMLQENRFYIFLIINKKMECYFKIADREDECIYEKVRIDTENKAASGIAAEYAQFVNETRRGYYYGYK